MNPITQQPNSNSSVFNDNLDKNVQLALTESNLNQLQLQKPFELSEIATLKYCDTLSFMHDKKPKAQILDFILFHNIDTLYPNTQFKNRYLISDRAPFTFMRDVAAGYQMHIDPEELPENKSVQEFTVPPELLLQFSQTIKAHVDPNADLLMQLNPFEKQMQPDNEIITQKLNKSIENARHQFHTIDSYEEPISVIQSQKLFLAHINYTHELIDTIRVLQNPHAFSQYSYLIFDNKMFQHFYDMLLKIKTFYLSLKLLCPLTKTIDSNLNRSLMSEHLHWVQLQLHDLSENIQTCISHNYHDSSPHDSKLVQLNNQDVNHKVITLSKVKTQLGELSKKIKKLIKTLPEPC